MKSLVFTLSVVSILFGCVSKNYNVPSNANSLEELYNQKNYAPQKEIKTCGWATKSFENVKITVAKNNRHGNKAKGFGVDWLDEEPYTDKPEWRCITGVIEPISGWDDYPLDDDIIVLSTGHGFQWIIVQTNLSRD